MRATPPAHAADAPAILFVHGARHAAWCWREHFLPYFARQGFDAWAVSFRGHGASPGRDQLNQFTLDDYVDDVRAALAAMPPRPALAGHSLGGAACQRVLRDEPARLRGAALLASVPPGGVERRDVRRTNILKRRDRLQLVAHLRGQPVPFPDQILFSAALPAAERARYAAQIQPESPLIQRDIHAPIVAAPPEDCPPLLVLGAGRDWFLSPGAVRRTGRFYGVEPTIFPGMAHDMMLEPGWRAVADAIIAFLRGLP